MAVDLPFGGAEEEGLKTLIRRGNQWWIEIGAANTKTKHAIELPWPEPLIAALDI